MDLDGTRTNIEHVRIFSHVSQSTVISHYTTFFWLNAVCIRKFWKRSSYYELLLQYLKT